METPGAAFITGGGSGIGKACLLEFARSGSKGVLVADIDLTAAQSTAEEAKSIATNPEFRAEAIHIDVTREESIKDAVKRMIEVFGRIDYCVHSAGVGPRSISPVADYDPEDFKRMVDVHINGAFYVTSAVSAAMKSQELLAVDESSDWRGETRGNIVLLASVASVLCLPNMVAYNAAKHAVLGITRSAAIDNIEHSIRVNCICPGFTDTPMMAGIKAIPLLAENCLKVIPMNRFARAEEVADAAMYLSGKRSSFVTGTALSVDGGTNLSVKLG